MLYEVITWLPIWGSDTAGTLHPIHRLSRSGPTDGNRRLRCADHGDFASIADNGTGGLVKTDITDLFAENFRLWIESGYVRSGSSVNEVNYFYMIPVMASFDYSMRLSRRVTLSPVLSVGYTYVNLSYRKNGSSIYETKSAWEPATSAGIDLDFSISRNSSITLGSRYGAVFEKEKNMYFSMFTRITSYNVCYTKLLRNAC